MRNVGEDPVILYLSVTPHIQPPHTGWTEAGQKVPPKFNPSTTYDVQTDRVTPIGSLVARQLASSEALACAVAEAVSVQREQLKILEQKVTERDTDAALRARDVVWSALCPMFESVFELANDWNNLTYRTAEPDFGK